MGNRRKAREASLQLLYEIDLAHEDCAEVLKVFLRDPARTLQELPDAPAALEEVKQFTVQITEGVYHNVREIDQLVEGHSTHWKISRMSVVDRNILRMGVFELLYCPDIPASVTINEAIEIAKRFGTDESGSFVNGVLDHIAKELKKV
jgi:N utilization substance protein B